MRTQRASDVPLIVLAIALSLFGVAMVYSAGQTDAPTVVEHLWKRQALWLGLGMLMAFLVSRAQLRFLDWVTLPAYVASNLVLLALLFVGKGAKTGAANHSWLAIGGVKIGQPSELAKIAVVLMLARVLASRKDAPTSLLDLWKPALVVGIPWLLIMAQPDLGTGLVFIGIFFSMLFWSGASWQLLVLVASPVVSLVLAVSTTIWGAWFLLLIGLVLWYKPYIAEGVLVVAANVIMGVVAPSLIHERTLDETQTVAYYLPEMAGTAYQDATLRQVLDMQIGVQYSELYADPMASIWDYGRAGGLRPRGPDYTGPGNFYEYLCTLRKEGTHGETFSYKTINTEVLCWVMKRVSGIALQDMLSERLWSPLGCEEDGYITVDPIGVAMGGAGLSASLRDLCRFGELMRCEGAWHGKQVIPAEVIADIRRGSDPLKFAPAGYTLLPGYSYRNMWWVSHNALDLFEARGIHGQRLYIAPKADLVIARFASHPLASSAANDTITLPAFAAVARLLMAG